MPAHEIIAKVICESFHNWAQHDKAFKKHYPFGPNIIEILQHGLSEMLEHKPYYWDVWWVKNHVRFTKKYRQEDFRIGVQAIHKFLSLYSRGKLYDANYSPRTTGKKKTRQAETS